MEKEKDPIYGLIKKDEGEYNLLAEYAGAEEFDKDRLLNVLLEEISDERFNELLKGRARVKTKIELVTKEVILQGQILGGGDPTRPLRERESEIKPQQEIKILLDEIPDDEILGLIEGKRAKIIAIT